MRVIAFLLVLCIASLAVAADEKPAKRKNRPPVTKKTADKLPEGILKFNGMVVGRLVKKDVEKGTFIVNVDAVPRVWRNSKAENPKSIVGKNILVDGVFGKWLDVLLVMREGETLECEAKHDGGGNLTFPGELLRKVAPYDPKDYPVLPEAFRGFRGAVSAKIVSKDAKMFEFIVKVDKVIDTWKNNRAKKPKSIEGRQMMLAGFWRRKNEYHGLKVGDRIEVGLQHIGMRSDHVTVAEFVRKAGKSTAPNPSSTKETASGFNGFFGSIVGRLEAKDVEKGSLKVKVQAVPRVWRNSKAKNPKQLIGRTVEIDGVSGRLLDVLLVARVGDTLELGARHEKGDRLSFPGELFRKVAPYKAEDFPVVPDGFRGFRGVVTGKIMKKDAKVYGLVVKIDGVKKSWDGSKAEKVSEVVGKNVSLAGFWRRKAEYGKLKVGDRIETGLRHQITGSDILTVAEKIRKLDAKQVEKE